MANYRKPTMGNTQGMIPEADLLIAVLRRMAKTQGVLSESDVARAKAMLGIGTPMAKGVQAGQAVRQGVQRAGQAVSGMVSTPRAIVQAGQGFFQGLGGAPTRPVQPYTPQQRQRLMAQGTMARVQDRQMGRRVGQALGGGNFGRPPTPRAMPESGNAKQKAIDARRAQIIANILGM